MVVKKNGIPYILESTEDYYNCEYSGSYKNGVIFHKAYDRIKNYSGRVYLSKNNLNNYINNKDITKFLQKHGHLNFLEENFGCLKMLINFLYSCGVFKSQDILILMEDFNNKNYYKIKYTNIENIKLRNDYVIKNGK
jgi:hypothetical protein